MSRPDEDYEAEDAAFFERLAEDLDADRLDAADLAMRARYLSDEEEAELERLAFEEETAGMDSVDVYPAQRRATGEEGGK